MKTKFNILVISECSKSKLLEEHCINYIELKNNINDLDTYLKNIKSPKLMAKDLYQGKSHKHTHNTVKYLRGTGNVFVDWFILSAGFGLISSDKEIPCYESSFNNIQQKSERRAWADQLGISVSIKDKLLENKYDLGIIILSTRYLEACNFNETKAEPPFPIIYLVSEGAIEFLYTSKNTNVVPVESGDPTLFGEIGINLKGKIFFDVINKILKKEEILNQFKENGYNTFKDSIREIREETKLNKTRKRKSLL